ncbi:hypothetical protein [Comamonas odontotermitis]|uniref:hypothetical protein n=1 Tax=Comamonas odontotermitis TaxID=379895 RepID=UPI001CC6F05C|nr:hypothetical protein [Comamonas odontotermitis]UBB18347.1 hypothetical protein LAD35_06835 [Comamonas odontotermitis]
MIKQHQIYTLPSGAIVKVNSKVVGCPDWNCIYQDKGRLGVQISLSAAFISKFGEVWA